MAGSACLSENEAIGTSAGGAAEGKFSHRGVLDGEEKLESHYFTL